jgi:hypothetical protein
LPSPYHLAAQRHDEARSAEKRKLAEGKLVRTSCVNCGDSFEGSFRGGRAWFAAHRSSAHAELAQPARRQRRGRSATADFAD